VIARPSASEPTSSQARRAPDNVATMLLNIPPRVAYGSKMGMEVDASEMPGVANRHFH
jgi:hypothetical protein